jgi:hypothetical protein
MARSLVSVTQSWVSTFTGPGVVTVEEMGEGVLLLNDTNSDTAALQVKREDGPRAQVDQRSAVATWIRATGDGWKVTVDTGA